MFLSFSYHSCDSLDELLAYHMALRLPSFFFLCLSLLLVLLLMLESKRKKWRAALKFIYSFIIFFSFLLFVSCAFVMSHIETRQQWNVMWKNAWKKEEKKHKWNNNKRNSKKASENEEILFAAFFCFTSIREWNGEKQTIRRFLELGFHHLFFIIFIIIIPYLFTFFIYCL